MTPDFRKRAIVPMRSKRTMELEFEIIVYWMPNPIISELASRYPDHQSTIWELR